MASPTTESVLAVLPKSRLVELGRELSIAVPSSATKEQQLDRLARATGLKLPTVVRLLDRDELKHAEAERLAGATPSGAKKAVKAKAPGRAKKTQPTEQLSLTPEPANE